MANIIDKTRPEQVELTPIEYAGFGKPEDSRLKVTQVTHPTMPLERTFCTNCGSPYGWVTTASSKYIEVAEVLVFCEKCEAMMNEKLGPIPFPVAAGKDATEIPPYKL